MGCPTWRGKPCLRAFNSIRDAFEGAVGGRSGNVQLVAVPFEGLATPAVGWCEQWWTLQQINTNSSGHPFKSPNSKRFWWHRKWIITGWIWLRISLLVDKDPVVAAICGRQLSFDSDTGDRITAVGAAQCFLLVCAIYAMVVRFGDRRERLCACWIRKTPYALLISNTSCWFGADRGN